MQEEVNFRYTAQHKNYDEGEVVEILRASPQRITPRCPHFGVCGGCSLQHLDPQAQLEHKQQILIENLERIGNIYGVDMLPAIAGPLWGYRRRARLGVKYVLKKEALLVGFREKKSGLLAELHRCEVLHPAVGEKLIALRTLISGLKSYQRIPQVEVAMGDTTTALVFRHLEALCASDRDQLAHFGRQHDIAIYLQPNGPDTVTPLWPEAPQLSYHLPAWQVELHFRPTDFTQVNSEINQQMVGTALRLLDPQPEEEILDLFCGLGNFTLPLARLAKRVTGVEGSADLVTRARENSQLNGITNTDFFTFDLVGDSRQAPWSQRRYAKVLIDPPRTGAFEVMALLPKLAPSRVVYVSCNPATLARDAGALVHRHGYRLVNAGVLDMFPHTTHVESIALFERN